jgi:UDP-glucose 4-epimerase
MSKFINNAIAGRDITIYGDGMQTRTFCYKDDNIDACYNAFTKDQIVNDTVNIGSDFETTIIDLAKNIIAVTESRSKIVFLPPLKEGDMTRRKPDNTKMRELLGRPLISIEDGIRKTVASGKYNF